jgi:hypothetical protein
VNGFTVQICKAFAQLNVVRWQRMRDEPLTGIGPGHRAFLVVSGQSPKPNQHPDGNPQRRCCIWATIDAPVGRCESQVGISTLHASPVALQL